MDLSRRSFLKGVLTVSATAAFPSVWLRAREAAALEACEQGVNLVLVQLDGGNDGLNTVIPLTNGSGSNRTVYEAARPYLGIPVSELQNTQIDNDPLSGGALALHPHMNALKALYDQGNVAVILGTHYDNGNLSHDVSNLIWYRADPTLSYASGGWMGQSIDAMCAGQENAAPAVDVNSRLSPLFLGRIPTIAVQSLSDLELPFPIALSHPAHWMRAPYRQTFRGAYDRLVGDQSFIGAWARAGRALLNRMDDYRTASSADAENLNALINGADGHPIAAPTRQGYGLAYGLRLVFALIRGRQPGNEPLGCRIFRVGIGGFDTHSSQGHHIPLSQKPLNQKVAENFPGEFHGRLLHQVDKAIAAFWADLKNAGLHRNTLILTFTEFGRRIAENGDHNADSGTDHGTASPMFVIGPSKTERVSPTAPFLAGGVYGAYPELHLPDRNGNMVHQLDFRHVYGEVLHHWLGLSLATTNQILGAANFSYRTVGFLTG